MRKIIFIGIASLATTFGLFIFMASLIDNGQVVVQEPPKTVPVSVARTPEESQVAKIERIKLAPPKVQPKPLALKETIDDSHLLDTTISFEPPTVQIKSNVATRTFSGPRDASARPIFRVNPNYPIEASRNGIEGWVVLGFDINKIGQVVNVKVINAEPKRIFNKAAKQALRKWKYQAKTVDGLQVMQHSLTVQLDFKMDQST